MTFALGWLSVGDCITAGREVSNKETYVKWHINHEGETSLSMYVDPCIYLVSVPAIWVKHLINKENKLLEQSNKNEYMHEKEQKLRFCLLVNYYW